MMSIKAVFLFTRAVNILLAHFSLKIADTLRSKFGLLIDLMKKVVQLMAHVLDLSILLQKLLLKLPTFIVVPFLNLFVLFLLLLQLPSGPLSPGHIPADDSDEGQQSQTCDQNAYVYPNIRFFWLVLIGRSVRGHDSWNGLLLVPSVSSFRLIIWGVFLSSSRGI